MKFLPTFTQPVTFSLAHSTDFSQFYDRTHLQVFRYVMVLCGGNQAEAEDITADAYLRAWQKREQFSGSPGAAFGWVITIARNLLIDQRRAEKNRGAGGEVEEDTPDLTDPIEKILVDKEQLQQALAAVRQLPFEQANLVTLRYVLGWRVNAIAEHLNIPENTVSVTLRRAAARLQSQLVSSEIPVKRGQ